MYKLIKEEGDGIRPLFISDKAHSLMSGQEFAEYKYVGDDPDGPDEDELNRQHDVDHYETHIITEEDLDNNPELKADGVKVGDTIKYPKSQSGEKLNHSSIVSTGSESGQAVSEEQEKA